jgi:anti-sigma factor RsiW
MPPADLDAHLAECPACRVQWRVHREMIAGLDGGPAPALSPGFNAELRMRLEREAALARRSAPAWPRLMLRFYWALAAAACLLILFHIDWGTWLGAFSPAARAWCLFALLAAPMIALFDLGRWFPASRARAHSAG